MLREATDFTEDAGAAAELVLAGVADFYVLLAAVSSE